MKQVSVVILNYKTPLLTIECIKSIIKHTRDIDYEVVLVDNNSELFSCYRSLFDDK